MHLVISPCHGFREIKYFKNWPNKTQNYQLFHWNKDGTQTLTFFVEVHPRNTQTKFIANPCSSLREVKCVILHSDIYIAHHGLKHLLSSAARVPLKLIKWQT